MVSNTHHHPHYVESFLRLILISSSFNVEHEILCQVWHSYLPGADKELWQHLIAEQRKPLEDTWSIYYILYSPKYRIEPRVCMLKEFYLSFQGCGVQ